MAMQAQRVHVKSWVAFSAFRRMTPKRLTSYIDKQMQVTIDLKRVPIAQEQIANRAEVNMATMTRSPIWLRWVFTPRSLGG